MKQLSVLMVDDGASVQNIVKEALGDGGFISKVASSEEAAALKSMWTVSFVIDTVGR